jgi:hypothetical protein
MRWVVRLIVLYSGLAGLQSVAAAPVLPRMTVFESFLRWINDVDLTMTPDEGFYGLFVIGIAGLVYRAHRGGMQERLEAEGPGKDTCP